MGQTIQSIVKKTIASNISKVLISRFSFIHISDTYEKRRFLTLVFK